MTDFDVTHAKAQRLVNACNGLGLQARLHWDRSPWCCQVALVDTHEDDFNENTPSIFFMLENVDSYKIANGKGWKWYGQLHIGHEITEQDDLYDISFDVIERTWLGEDEHTVAYRIALLTSMIDISALWVES